MYTHAHTHTHTYTYIYMHTATLCPRNASKAAEPEQNVTGVA
jgi:hypothetical protein